MTRPTTPKAKQVTQTTQRIKETKTKQATQETRERLTKTNIKRTTLHHHHKSGKERVNKEKVLSKTKRKGQTHQLQTRIQRK